MKVGNDSSTNGYFRIMRSRRDRLEITEEARKPALVPGIHPEEQSGQWGSRKTLCVRALHCVDFQRRGADTPPQMALIVLKIRSSSAPVPQEDRERDRERGPAGFPRLRKRVRLDVHKFGGWRKPVENYGSSIRGMALRGAGRWS